MPLIAFRQLTRAPTLTTAGVTWLTGDHLGSASLATNAAGAKLSDERYLPYGATRSGGVATDYQFTGQKLDTGTGLYYYGARYYDPVVGRFISADTVVPGAGNPQALNRYAYTMNNPVRYTDPSGHMADQGGADIGCSAGDTECVGNPYWASGASAVDLFWDWYFESGSQVRAYGPDAAITKDVRNDEGVAEARNSVRTARPAPGETKWHLYSFNNPLQPFREHLEWQLFLDNTGAGSILGGYTVYVTVEPDGTAVYRVYNITSRESATRLLGGGPSLEQRWTGTTEPDSLLQLWPQSILDAKARSETPPSAEPWIGPNGWGGNLTQWYMWVEALSVTPGGLP
jgi:RHS repeat-associated protein